MPRLAAFLALLVLSACKVERTPPEFYEHRDPSVVEEQEAQNEVRVRLGAFQQAMSRGDHGDAVEALNPLPLAAVIGLRPHGGIALRGPQGLAQALGEIETPGRVLARLPDLTVSVSLREGMGWFSSHLELLPTGAVPGPAERLRVSGVFLSERGEWRLTQLHLSRPEAVPPPADSAGADTGATAPAAPGASPAADSARGGAG
ncbi:MAG TPA: nuclear transport factor 2 family protein [Longimicrobiaceae bacterium]|nr:nuclear transport factor 2 family protein [Longimicrobiaceae bacterium]